MAFKKTELTAYQANTNSDKRRAEVAAARVRFEISVFKHIQHMTEWTSMTDLYVDTNSDQARRIRRFLHLLEAAGFIEIRHRWDGWARGNVAQFRVLLNPEES